LYIGTGGLNMDINYKDIADGKFSEMNAQRVINVLLPSGQRIENVPYRDIDEYIMLISEGKEDFLILDSQDGYLQFYGVNDQFVAEVRVNLVDGDFRTYSIIDKDRESLVDRIKLKTPYGEFTPTQREVVSLELIKSVVRKYYENITEDSFIKSVPCIETTEETKRYMGL